MIVTLVLPAQRAEAVVVSQILTQTATQFEAGKFGLTGMAVNGGVQLVRLGQLRRWQTASGSMCRPLINMATASFGPHIYSIGGTIKQGSPNPQDIPLDEICRNEVLGTNAELKGWTRLPTEDMPAPRTSAVAAAVPQPSNRSLGYLYNFGGRSGGTGSQRSTIFRSAISANGALSSWITETETLPTDREQMAVASYTADPAAGGKSFIYVIGGYDEPFNSVVYSQVVRYEVQANGSLIEKMMPPLPLPVLSGTSGCPEYIGLKQADATTFDMVDTNGAEHRYLVVTGGILQLGRANAGGTNCAEISQASARVFVAEINEATGDLIWQNAPAQRYTMPTPISQTRLVGVDGGKMYAVGGTLNSDQSEVTRNAYSAYISPQSLTMSSYGLGDSASNFLASPNTLTADQARAAHGMEVVTIANRPIAFLFGGTNPDQQSFRDDTMYGFIGRQEDFDETTGGYAAEGGYLSQVYTLRGPGRPTELRWTAAITPTGTVTTDIKLRYRVANAINELGAAPWVDVDGNPGSSFGSVVGANVGTSTSSQTGRFFQYYASLTTSNPELVTATPVLNGPVSVKYVVEGHPSLYVDASSNIPTVRSGTVVVPDIKIVNDTPPNSSNTTETVLDADIEGDGTFFVELYTFPPNTTPVQPMPNGVGIYPLTSAAFAEIGKTTMTVDKIYQIPAGNWRQTCPTIPNCPPANWQRIFNKVGPWKVYVVIDTGNNVTEADAPPATQAWEEDNNDHLFTVVSEVSGATIFMPVTFKTPPAANR